MTTKYILIIALIGILLISFTSGQVICNNSAKCEWNEYCDVAVTANNGCVNCYDTVPHCAQCQYTGPGQATCKSCSLGYFLQPIQNICSRCRLGSFDKDPTTKIKDCVPCTQGCIECQSKLNGAIQMNECLNCKREYLIKTGTSSVPTICDACRLIGTTGVCTKCSRNANYENGIKCDECNNDVFGYGYLYALEDTSNNGGTCNSGTNPKCKTDCKACGQYDTNCTRCDQQRCFECSWRSNNFALDPVQNKCYKCAEIDQQCPECQQQCTKCKVFDGQAQCTECSGNNFGLSFTLDSQNNKCYDCKLATTDRKCTRCSSVNSVLTCVECQYCDNCNQGGFFFNPITIPVTQPQCKPCTVISPGCQYCSSTICRTCHDGYFINPLILDQCPHCNTQIPGCASCGYNMEWNYGTFFTRGVSYLKCYRCQTGQQLNQVFNYCSTCPEQQILDATICKDCSQLFSGCKHCYRDNVNNLKCFQCKDGYYKDKDDFTCKLCNNTSAGIPGCQTCDYQRDQTLAIIGILRCSQCTSVSDFVDKDYHCQACTQNVGCVRCYWRPLDYANREIGIVKCTQCIDGKNLQEKMNLCQDCEDDEYEDPAAQYCVECWRGQDRCKKCLKISSFQCLECSGSDYYLNNTFQCTQCSTQTGLSNCKYCFVGVEQDYCWQCNSGFYSLPPQTANGEWCISCQVDFPNCSDCSQQRCYKCLGNYSLIPQTGKCTLCQDGFYEDDSLGGDCKTCKLSLANCLQCYYDTTATAPYCGLCEKGFFLGSAQTCTKCETFWSNCTSCTQQSCNTCDLGYTQFNQQCVNCATLIPNCIVCYNESYCQVCQFGFLKTASGQCTRCGSTEYESSTGECIKCDSQISGCDKCFSGILDPIKIPSAPGKCEQGKYFDMFKANGSCVNCNAIDFCLAGQVTCNDTDQSTTYSRSSCLACMQGYVLSQGSCQMLKCAQNCLSCTTQYGCDICQPQFYKQPEGTQFMCVETCGLLYQLQQETNECVCAQQTALYQGQCVTQCPTQDAAGGLTYLTNINGKCACNSEAVNQDGQCVQSCSNNYLLDEKTRTCLMGKIAGTVCNSCKSGSLLANNQCIPVDQYVPLCTQGHFDTVTNKFYCSKCSYGYGVQENIIQDQSKVPPQILGKETKCVPCDLLIKGCQVCENITVSLFQTTLIQIIPVCLQCALNLNKIANGLVCSSCTQGQYLSISSSSTSICVNCSLKISNCVDCFVNQQNSNQVYCLQCLPGYAATSTGECQKCMENCDFCTSVDITNNTVSATQNLQQCVQCKSGFFYSPFLSKCVQNSDSKCKLAYAVQQEESIDIFDGECVPSPLNTCNSSTPGTSTSTTTHKVIKEIEQCIKCLPGYYYNNMLSLCSSCKPDQFFNNLTSRCESCSIERINNADVNTHCNLCIYQQKNRQKVCFGCEKGYYLNKGGQCQSCFSMLPNCSFCQIQEINQVFEQIQTQPDPKNPKQFIEVSSTTKEQFMCNECVAGFALNGEGICQPCDKLIENCLTCRFLTADQSSTQSPAGSQGSTIQYQPVQCQLCKRGYTYNAVLAQCVECLQNQFMSSQGFCLNCSEISSNCEECFWDSAKMTPKFVCNKCKQGTFLYPGSSACEPCEYAFENCGNCKFNLNTGVMSCLNCNQGFYFDQVSKKCLKCTQEVQNCQFCSYNSSIFDKLLGMAHKNAQCTLCNSGLYLHSLENVCTRCFKDQYYDQTQLKCLSCSESFPGCQSCGYLQDITGAFVNKCFQCNYGKYWNQSTQACMNCSDKVTNCASCVETIYGFTCNSCSKGYYYLPQASPRDFQSLIQTSGTCKSCSSEITNCAECKLGFQIDGYQFQPKAICTTCNSSFVLFNQGQFCINCQPGSFFNTVTKTCVSCTVTNCGVCSKDQDSQLETCHQCKKGFYKINNKCESCTVLPAGIANAVSCAWSQSANAVAVIECATTYYNFQNRECKLCSSEIANCNLCQAIYDNNSINTQQQTQIDGENGEAEDYTLSMIDQTIREQYEFINGNTVQYRENKIGYLDEKPTIVCNQCQLNSLTKYFNIHKNSCDKCKDFEIFKVDVCETCDQYSATSTGCRACSLDINSVFTCDSCYEGFYLDTGTGLCAQCSSFTTQGGVTLTHCSDCIRRFDVIISDWTVQCLDCDSPYRLDPLTSLCQTCTIYQYKNAGATCSECSEIPNCKFCSLQYGQPICTECFDGFLYSKIFNSCQPCSDLIKNCDSCVRNNDWEMPFCLECKVGYNRDKSTGTCQQCKKWEYFDNTLEICKICHVNNCQQCSSDGLSCKICQEGFLISLGKCEVQCSIKISNCSSCQKDSANVIQCLYCSQGYFLDITTNTCSSCDKNIVGCTYCNSSGTNCAACRNGFALIQNKCVECSTLQANCKECIIEGQNIVVEALGLEFNLSLDENVQKQNFKCLSCNESAKYALNIVNSTCQAYSNNTLEFCDNNCSKCVYDPRELTYQCRKCPEGSVPTGNKCYIQIECEIGKTQQQNTCVECETLINNCYSCSLDNVSQTIQCDICKHDYVLKTNMVSENDFADSLKLMQNHEEYFTNACIKSIGYRNCPIGCDDCTQDIGDLYCSSLQCTSGYIYNVCAKNCSLSCTTLTGCQVCYDTVLQEDGGFKEVLPYCEECEPGYYLFDNTCIEITACPSQQAYHPLYLSCEPCPSNCVNCKIELSFDKSQLKNPVFIGTGIYEQKTCISCSATYQPNLLGECVKTGITQEQLCGQLFPGCKTCIPDLATGSLKCSACLTASEVLHNLVNGQCVIDCTTEFAVGNLADCTQCYYTLEATIYNIFCTKCGNSKILSYDGTKCVDPTVAETIASGDFPTYPSLSIYNSCTSNCDTTDPKFCLYNQLLFKRVCSKCVNNTFKLTEGFKCVSKVTLSELNCPSGFYEDVNNGSECITCPYDCDECQLQVANNNFIQCTKFKFGYSLRRIQDKNLSLALQQQCAVVSSQSLCQPGYFESSPATCSKCQSGCQDCLLDIVNKVPKCIKCQNDTQWRLNSQGQCINVICKSGQYLNLNKGCLSCPVNCQRCKVDDTDNKLKCEVCISGYDVVSDATSLYNGMCVIDIAKCDPPNVLLNWATSVLHPFPECIPCPDHCSSCSTDITIASLVYVCTACDSVDYEVSENQYCVLKTCIGNYYSGIKEGKDGCNQCLEGCSSCYLDYSLPRSVLNRVKCTACQTNLGYELVATTNSCVLKAITCSTGQYLKTISVSPKIQSCMSCPQGCSTCYLDKIDPSKIYCRECLTYFKKNSKTLQCEIDISQFDNVACVVGQRFDYLNQQCISCPTICPICSTNQQTLKIECASCDNINGYYLKQNSCVKQCSSPTPLARITDQSTLQQECVACSDSKCILCSLNYSGNNVQELCYSCQDNYYLNEAICVSNPICNQSSYITYQKVAGKVLTYQAKCQMCPEGCVSCSSNDSYNSLSEVSCSDCIKADPAVIPAVKQDYTLISGGKCVPTFLVQPNPCSGNQFTYIVKSAAGVQSWKTPCQNCSLQTGCDSCQVFSNESGTTTIDCLACQVGYSISFDKYTMYGKCNKLPVCTQNQFVLQVNVKPTFQCLDCPQNCTTCGISNIKDKNSVYCKTCQAGYVLTNFEPQTCAKQSTTISNFCSDGYFVMLIFSNFGDGFLVCEECPKNCMKCHLKDVADLNSSKICDKCNNDTLLVQTFETNSTTNVQSSFCRKLCNYDEYTTDIQQCSPCSKACNECKGPSDSDCISCSQGFQQDSTNKCVLKEQTPVLNCGIKAYYDEKTNSCVCLQFGQVFQLVAGNPDCINMWELPCPVGQFRDANLCLPCYSSECAVCNGPQPSQCVQCKLGYYFDLLNKQCTQCSSNCQKCTSANICEICSPGSYKVNKDFYGNPQSFCLSQCPTGTLPYIPSLYYLNNNLFTQEEIASNTQFSQAEQLTTASIGTLSAIAVNYDGTSNYVQVPWSVTTDGISLVQNMPIVLECVPCQQGCQTCAVGWLKVQTTTNYYNCVFGTQCPENYYLKQVDENTQICYQVPNTSSFYIKQVDLPTLTLDAGVQPSDKKFVAEMMTSVDSQQANQLKYDWQIVSVSKDTVGEIMENNLATQDISAISIGANNFLLSESMKYYLMNNAMQAVDNTQKIIVIPPSNFEKNYIYTFKVIVSYQGSIEKVVDFDVIVRSVPQYRSIEDLGICPGLITVDPIEGISGQTVFTAQYIFGNQQIFMKYPDSMKFIIEYNNIVLISTELNGRIQFVVPGDISVDQFVEIKFIVNYREQQFISYRKILAAKNPTFSLATDPILQTINQNGLRRRLRILQGTSGDIDPISVGQLAMGASTLNKQKTKQTTCAAVETYSKEDANSIGPCTLTEGAAACCGNGTCAVDGTITQYKCQCNDGFSGRFCHISSTLQQSIGQLSKFITEEIDTLGGFDKNNRDTILSIIQQLVQTESLDQFTQEKLLDYLQEIGNSIENSKQFAKVLEQIQEISRSSNVGGDVEFAKQQHLKAQSIINESITGQAKNLNKGNYQIEFNTDSISGKSKYFDLNEVSQQASMNIQDIATAQIQKSALQNKQEVIITGILSGKDQYSTAENSSQIVSQNLEFNVIDKNSPNTIMNLNSLTGDCPFAVDFTVDSTYFGFEYDGEDGELVEQIIEVLYYDQIQNKYLPHGIEIKSMEEVGTNTKISACSKHLSSFAVSVSYRVTVIEVPETSGPELRKRIYTSDQALLHYFTMVFGLAWFVLVILVA